MRISVDEDGRVLLAGTWDEVDEFALALRDIVNRDQEGSFLAGTVNVRRRIRPAGVVVHIESRAALDLPQAVSRPTAE